MFSVTPRHQTPAYTVRIRSRDTHIESIKRLALSILATAATYFLCPRPVFLITAAISLSINLPLAYRMFRTLFRVFEHITDVNRHNGRARSEPRPETGSATHHGAVGHRAVTSTYSSRPLAQEAVRAAQAPVPSSQPWAAPLSTEHRVRQGPQALHVPEPSSRGPAWVDVPRAHRPASGFQPWSSPDRASSYARPQPHSNPLPGSLDADLHGAVGARTSVRSQVPTSPPTLERLPWRDEEKEHKENRAPLIPGHGIVGSRQRRGR